MELPNCGKPQLKRKCDSIDNISTIMNDLNTVTNGASELSEEGMRQLSTALSPLKSLLEQIIVSINNLTETLRKGASSSSTLERMETHPTSSPNPAAITTTAYNTTLHKYENIARKRCCAFWKSMRNADIAKIYEDALSEGKIPRKLQCNISPIDGDNVIKLKKEMCISNAKFEIEKLKLIAHSQHETCEKLDKDWQDYLTSLDNEELKGEFVGRWNEYVRTEENNSTNIWQRKRSFFLSEKHMVSLDNLPLFARNNTHSTMPNRQDNLRMNHYRSDYASPIRHNSGNNNTYNNYRTKNVSMQNRAPHVQPYRYNQTAGVSTEPGQTPRMVTNNQHLSYAEITRNNSRNVVRNGNTYGTTSQQHPTFLRGRPMQPNHVHRTF